MGSEFGAAQGGAAAQRVGLSGTERDGSCLSRTVWSAAASGCVYIDGTLLYIGGYRSHARHGGPFLL